MKEYFYELSDFLTEKLKGDEVLLGSFSGEQSDFVRFNRSLVRQAGSVNQGYFSLDLIRGNRHAQGTVTLGAEPGEDRARLEALLKELRGRLGSVPEDPYLLYATDVRSGEQIGEDRLPDREATVNAVLDAGRGKDLVGIYAAGGIFSGFANSLGQRNWSATYSFHLDWCFYRDTDKAAKNTYAGFEWDHEQFARKVAEAGERVAILDRPAKTISPGEYRVYLAPAALDSIMDLLGWGGFGLKTHRTKSTPLLKMIADGAQLHPSITITENTADGLGPNFQSKGFIKPDRVTLIEAGKCRDCLICPRSAKEYGEDTNGAGEGEYPESLDLGGGDVPADRVLEQLDTGVYVTRLWYLNYSDRPSCRITGMTRFATCWVEGGRIVAPLNVMRFDETIYRVLGENLLGLTAERELIPSASTYGGRSTDSARLPGALVKDFTFTL